jgi:hypothetical protein
MIKEKYLLNVYVLQPINTTLIEGRQIYNFHVVQMVSDAEQKFPTLTVTQLPWMLSMIKVVSALER